MKKIFQQFIDGAIRKLQADPRFCGLAVGGSWISNELDEYSDLDLVVVANDENYARVFEERVNIARSLGDCVSCFTGEHVGEPRLLICLFREPLIHVDLKFVALKDFGDRIEDPWIAWEVDGGLAEVLRRSSRTELKPDLQWIEDRIWTWIHYGAVKALRGEMFEAIGFLSFLREQVLGPMALWSAGKPVRGVRKLEQRLPEFTQRLQATIPAVLDRRNCLDAILASAEIYRELRSRYGEQGPAPQFRAECECMSYVLASRDRFRHV